MKIAIVCFYFPPDITPRSFRAESLYSTLKRKGHDVVLITPSKVDRSSVVGGSVKPYLNNLLPIKSLFRMIIEKLFPGNKDLKYFRFFIANLSGKKFDLVISIGLPFSVHLAVAFCRRFKGLSANKVIFDYGDPYSLNPHGRCCFYAPAIEKWAISHCDFILTPIDETVTIYEKLMTKSGFVKVIPQGYKIDDIVFEGYEEHKIPTFCYAGLLYKGLREPTNFLSYLSDLDSDFKFIVYTDLNNQDVNSILKKYKLKLGTKLELRQMIPRDQCLVKLSSMDFLVNFENTSGVQKPSKLIDYAISKRPFLSISSIDKDFFIFDEFLNKDFRNFTPIDVSCYDENLIADRIVSLIEDRGNDED